jgi:hypothetical protein
VARGRACAGAASASYASYRALVLYCSRDEQPGGICVYVVQKTPEGPGSGLRPGRKRFLCQLPLWFYIYFLGKTHLKDW